MRSRELVSVIVPVFNCEKYLKKCIESVLNQTYPYVEIILVNDGSTDNSNLICLEYQTKYKNINYIKKDNAGVSSARNVGIKNSKGSYIFFLDSDDFLDQDSISILVNNYCEDTLIGLIPSGFSYNKSIYSIEELFEGIMTNKILGNVWGYLFNKDKLGNIMFNENISFMEDTFFLFQYLKNIKKVQYLNDIHYNYVFNKNSITNKKNISSILKNVANFHESVNSIKKIMCELNYNNTSINKLVSYKLIKLTESEFIKLCNISDIKKFNNNELVRSIIYNNEVNNIVLKFFRCLVKLRSAFISLVYIHLRKLYIKIR